MSTISSAFNRTAFQPKPVAFGGAGNTNQARFSGMDVLKGFAPALLDSMAKQPNKVPGKLNYFA